MQPDRLLFHLQVREYPRFFWVVHQHIIFTAEIFPRLTAKRVNSNSKASLFQAVLGLHWTTYFFRINPSPSRVVLLCSVLALCCSAFSAVEILRNEIPFY